MLRMAPDVREYQVAKLLFSLPVTYSRLNAYYYIVTLFYFNNHKSNLGPSHIIVHLQCGLDCDFIGETT